ncbi:hypothetical protein [Anaeromusa acidaminophila]|uniref:hypothetical protein n=1 Tax=Anaeromusa acidaminophila TaxID=81464 RepID=UPI0003641FC4|nr:hypothetical protein [Anaeromusa acidaminophila]
MSFWSMVLAFAPWISFKIIISLPIMTQVVMIKTGIIIAAAICTYQAWIGLHRGALLWGGLLFFGFALITVPVMNNVWVMQHLGVLSHGTLASFTWASILLKRPFTMEYAKQRVDPSLWAEPSFIRKNNIITGVWGCAFAISFINAALKLTLFPAEGALFEIIDNAMLLGAALFTSKYTKTKPETAAQ